MIRPFDSRLVRLGLIGVLAIALAACGRKSGLDAPPSASAVPPAQAERQPALGEGSGGAYGRGPDQPPAGSRGTVPQKDSFFLDWLLK